MDKNKPLTLVEANEILRRDYAELLHNAAIYPISDFGEKYSEEERYEFDDKEALIFLMLTGSISCINNHWWEDEWPVESRKTISLSVNTNDCFVYACSDAEEVFYDDLESLFLWKLWNKQYGDLIWASIKQNQKPLIEWVESMEKEGVPFTEMAKEWGLEDNHCNRIIPRW